MNRYMCSNLPYSLRKKMFGKFLIFNHRKYALLGMKFLNETTFESNIIFSPLFAICGRNSINCPNIGLSVGTTWKIMFNKTN